MCVERVGKLAVSLSLIIGHSLDCYSEEGEEIVC